MKGKKSDMSVWSDFYKLLTGLGTHKKVASFQDVQFTYEETTHPLSGIGVDRLCTLPCIVARNNEPTKEFRQRISTQRREVSKSSVGSAHDISQEFILEGSPLRLEEIANLGGDGDTTFRSECEIFERVDSRPVSVAMARYLASLYHLVHTSMTPRPDQDVPPLWVVTDGKDRQKIVYMGCVKLDGCIKAVQVTCQEISTGNDVSIAKILKEHKHCLKSEDVTKNFSATYEVINLVSLDTDDAYGSIKLKYDWSHTHEFLATPPLDADTKVLACVKPGDMSSAADEKYRELSALELFCEGLKTQHVCWAVEHRETPLLDSVKELFKEFTDSQLRTARKTNIASKDEEETLASAMRHLHLVQARKDMDFTENLWLILTGNRRARGDYHRLASAMRHLHLVQARKDMDFTENLWLILTECTSYQDLQDCLRYVMVALRDTDFIPLMSPNNETKLAQYILKFDRNNNRSLPNLEGLVPLEMLVDIGIHKLRRDYLHFFRGQENILPHDLIYYEADNIPFEDQIARLKKLHYALELFLVVKQHLHLSDALMAQTARLALVHYTHHEPDPNHVFSIPVKAKSVRAVMERCSPSTWAMELRSRWRKTQQTGYTWSIATSTPIIHHAPMTQELSFKSEPEEHVSSPQGNHTSEEHETSIKLGPEERVTYQFVNVREHFNIIF